MTVKRQVRTVKLHLHLTNSELCFEHKISKSKGATKRVKSIFKLQKDKAMTGEYYIESGAEPQKIIQFLEDKIYEYNSAKMDKDDGRLFCTVVRDENNNIIAGVAGWTWADACEITQLWVDETARKKGIGEMLLQVAEMEAKSKGCVIILVKTYSFQAPHFYQKYGYKIASTINGFPKGCNYYTLTKNIG